MRKKPSVNSSGKAPFGSRSYDPQSRENGLDWPANAMTMIGEKRLANLSSLVKSVIEEKTPGDMIETGVWRGGACIMMRAILFAYGVENRTVWVADSFQGLPPADPDTYPEDTDSDFHTYSELAISLNQVKENFSSFNLLDKQTRFLQGWFKDTLPDASIEKLAIMRLDGDMYESTMDALTNLYPKLSKNGYVIIDDYHVVPACKAAVNDFCTAQGITPTIVEIDGVGVYWKKLEQAAKLNTSEIERPHLNAETVIPRLEEAIASLRNSAMAKISQSLMERDAQISELNKKCLEADRLQGVVDARDNEIESLKQTLHTIYASRAWRLIQSIRSIKSKFSN